VWHPIAVSRHSFILWLVFKDALITKERMCKWGFEGDCLCLSCRGSIGSRSDLFFQCSFIDAYGEISCLFVWSIGLWKPGMRLFSGALLN
jgi:hypothetical protein